jgi:hypothetical protein
MYHRIFVVTGDQPESNAPVEYALALAAATGAELSILTVFLPPSTLAWQTSLPAAPWSGTGRRTASVSQPPQCAKGSSVVRRRARSFPLHGDGCAVKFGEREATKCLGVGDPCLSQYPNGDLFPLAIALEIIRTPVDTGHVAAPGQIVRELVEFPVDRERRPIDAFTVGFERGAMAIRLHRLCQRL